MILRDAAEGDGKPINLQGTEPAPCRFIGFIFAKWGYS